MKRLLPLAIAVAAGLFPAGCALTFRAPPSAVSDNQAVLHGSTRALNDDGTSEQGSYWFEWGGSEGGYVFKTPVREGTFPGGQQNPVFEPIRMQPARTYHYRLCGNTDGTTFCSADTAFESLDPTKVDYVVGTGVIWTSDGPQDSLSIDVQSGPSGEDPVGRYRTSSIQGGPSVDEEITCLRVTGRKAILGTAGAFRLIEWLPDFGAWRHLSEPLGGRDPATCPATVTSEDLASIENLGDFPYVEVNDAQPASG